MKCFYKFLFYKLFRFATAEQKSVSVNFNFTCLSSIFEILHLLIIILLLKSFYKIPFNLNPNLFSVIFLIFGTLFNYMYFIRTKRIERIHSIFRQKKYSIWKGNLLFFGYIIMLFVFIFLSAAMARNS